MIGSVVQVALGGALGAVARYGVGLVALRLFGAAPLGTMAVNIAGCVAMGVCAVALGPRFAPLLMVGALGGFTTFSAFALDAVRLWERGAPGLAAFYIAASVVLSLAGLLAGMAMAKGWME
ncbi:MAG: fluoride efflux transporter CrcB [Paracoccus sp. (in: a-proteobacteria)]|nr:fluoride efflux transporter CrcB [Paracoccus sp. (in: a-proteobacteria)]